MKRALETLSVLVLLASPGLAEPLAPAAVVDGYFAAYRAMNLEQMLAAYTDDAEFVDVAQRHSYSGSDGLRELLGRLIGMHHEMDVEIRRRVAADNVVAVDYLYRGTLSGEALRAATGKETCRDTTYSIPVTSWFEIENGRIRRQTDFIDLATLEDVRAQVSGAAAP